MDFPCNPGMAVVVVRVRGAMAAGGGVVSWTLVLEEGGYAGVHVQRDFPVMT